MVYALDFEDTMKNLRISSFTWLCCYTIIIEMVYWRRIPINLSFIFNCTFLEIISWFSNILILLRHRWIQIIDLFIDISHFWLIFFHSFISFNYWFNCYHFCDLIDLVIQKDLVDLSFIILWVLAIFLNLWKHSRKVILWNIKIFIRIKKF